MPDTDIRAALEGLTLFAGLSETQLDALAASAQALDLAKGREVFAAGQEAGGFYAVITGQVRIYRSSTSGKEQVLHVFGPGQAFGEAAVFAGGEFPASAQTLEDSRLLYFPRPEFSRLIASDPDLAMSMLSLLSARLRHFADKIEELSLKEVPARLAAYLVLLSGARKSARLDLDLPKAQLASYLGTTPESLSRALRRLADAGAVSVQGTRIHIMDQETLAALARDSG